MPGVTTRTRRGGTGLGRLSESVTGCPSRLSLSESVIVIRVGHPLSESVRRSRRRIRAVSRSRAREKGPGAVPRGDPGGCAGRLESIPRRARRRAAWHVTHAARRQMLLAFGAREWMPTRPGRCDATCPPFPRCAAPPAAPRVACSSPSRWAGASRLRGKESLGFSGVVLRVEQAPFRPRAARGRRWTPTQRGSPKFALCVRAQGAGVRMCVPTQWRRARQS